jgi:hypothetical protein
LDDLDNGVRRDADAMLERLIAEAEAEKQAEKIRDERAVRKQRALDEQVPRILNTLRAALKAKAEKYPGHFTFDIRPEPEAVIRGKTGRALEVEFLAESKVVAYRCGEIEGFCTFGLNEQNLAVICDGEGYPYESVDYVAEKLLALILQRAG